MGLKPPVQAVYSFLFNYILSKKVKTKTINLKDDPFQHDGTMAILPFVMSPFK